MTTTLILPMTLGSTRWPVLHGRPGLVPLFLLAALAVLVPGAAREDSRSGSTQELPSSRTLLRSTVIAAVTTLVLLITVVLPAEYGIDPTGNGQVLGLTRMGEIEVALAQDAAEAAAVESANAVSAASGPTSAAVGAAVGAHDGCRIRAHIGRTCES